MADEQEQSERTEDPTQRKLEQALERGDVGHRIRRLDVASIEREERGVGARFRILFAGELLAEVDQEPLDPTIQVVPFPTREPAAEAVVCARDVVQECLPLPPVLEGGVTD